MLAAFSVSSNLFVWVALLLALWIAGYFLYRFAMTRRKDFGMPVRRRLLRRGMHIERDEVAEVPFWWTDLQVQRAVTTHWRHSLRTTFLQKPEA